MAGKSTLPANATPRQKFVHYANIRATAAVRAIDNLTKLSADTKAYKFEKADAEKLESYITQAVSRMAAAFASPGGSKSSAAKIIE
jgi:hypothetical protein